LDNGEPKGLPRPESIKGEENMNFKQIVDKLRISKKKNKTYAFGSDPSVGHTVSNHGHYTIIGDSLHSLYDPYAPIENYDKAQQVVKKRIEKKPVEVWKELFDETPKIDTVGLDEKIKMVKKRFEYLKFLGGQTTDEDIALKYLNARKKFLKHRKSFVWPVTNQSKIDNLCVKYTLADTDFYSYSKCVPMEAIDELEKYIKAWNKVAGRNTVPVARLIVDDSDGSRVSEMGERKKDPILYVESPFGKWFYILGAWDKEVQYVDDIVYRGK
jgi:hypothetical protein